MYPVLGTEVPQLQIANGPETNRQHRENSPNSLLNTEESGDDGIFCQ